MRAFVLLALGPCAVIALTVAEPSREEAADTEIEDGDVVPVVGLAPAPRESACAAAAASAAEARTAVADRLVEEILAGVGPAPVKTRPLPMRVHIVDAETGVEHRDARWYSLLDPGPASFESGEQGDVPVPLDRRTDLDLSVVRHGGFKQHLSMWTPGGYEIARDATSLVAVWPFAREADVFVELTADGGPVPPDWSLDFEATVAGKRYDVAAEPVVAGVRLRGLPFRRRAKWSLRVTATAGGTCSRVAQGEMSDDANDVLHVPVDLPTMRSVFVGRGGHRNLRAGCGCGHRVRSGPADTARVIVTALRRDGRPVGSASVILRPVGGDDSRWRRPFSGSTDTNGRITWTDVADGTYRLELREPGLVPTSTLVTVPEGGELVVEVREQPGATIDVVVQDENGDGVPFAELTLKQPCGEGWIDLVDGVQRLDRFVDVRGRRVLENVEPGEVEIEASYADRKGRGVVRVAPGDSTRLSITIAHE